MWSAVSHPTSVSCFFIFKNCSSFESVLRRFDTVFAINWAETCGRSSVFDAAISITVKIAFIVIFIWNKISQRLRFPLVVLFCCCYFHFLTLKMNNFQMVMLPANILQSHILLTSLQFFTVYRALSHYKGDWGAVTPFSRWGNSDLESVWNIPRATWLLSGRASV